MAKLEQLVTPLELLAHIRGGALKGDILKQYKTTDQELAIMLQPLYRRGNMTKDEFNDFFKGLSVKPPAGPAGKPAVSEEKAEPKPEPGSPKVAAEDHPIGVAEIKAPESIEEGPIPGLEHVPAELERAVEQSASERPLETPAAPQDSERPASLPQDERPVSPRARPKPELKANAAPGQRKAGLASAPKTVSAPLKAVTRRAATTPQPADNRPEEAEVQPGAASAPEQPRVEPAIEPVTVTIEKTVPPPVDESMVAAAETKETLRAVLSRLDSIDARLSRIEQKLETG